MAQPFAKPLPVRLDDRDHARAAAEALRRHQKHLGQWLPFARIMGALERAPALECPGEPACHILVEIDPDKTDLAREILAGFFSPVSPAAGRCAVTTFLDEGSAPVVLVHLQIAGSALDEALLFGKAPGNCGVLLGDGERFAGSDVRRDFMEGQRECKEVSPQRTISAH